MLDVCLPGTGGMIPLINRFLACCWIEYKGKAFLIDCGEGTQIALKKAGCKIAHIHMLLITHLHADHVAGIPGLLLALSNSGRTAELHIVGPQGLRKLMSAILIFVPFLPFKIKIEEPDGSRAGSMEIDETEVAYIPLFHGITCLGYRVTVRRKPVFDPEKAERLNIPKEMYKILHSGNPVKTDDGKTIEPEMVFDGIRAPIKVCYCTDTLPGEAIAEFADGADLFVCEGMYGDEKHHMRMVRKGHMMFSESAALAKKAGVKKLWLTHFGPAMPDAAKYIEAARSIFPESTAGYDGIRITLGQ